ncbi:MAG: DUF892 family protein [Candidatus Hydrogenedentes bacterium]|nr:DUF892 family protein [Candidatus Hydrogenedentota bacterium]MBI3119157.1 DUF892 family protein [Candidatus Hydrogenedentota bacterium]
MTVESLRRVYLDRLAELRHGQQQLSHGLPRMAQAACSDRVSDLLGCQALCAKQNLERIEALLAAESEVASRARCVAARDALKAAEVLIEEEMDLELIDAGLVEICQRAQVNTLEILRNAADLAQALGLKPVAGALHEMRREEEVLAARWNLLAEQYSARAAWAV